jgi:hypothetical protein
MKAVLAIGIGVHRTPLRLGERAGWRLPSRGLLCVLAASGFEAHLLGEGGEQARLPFALAGDRPDGAVGRQVEQGPQLHEPVEAVEAQCVLVPAGTEGGGEVTIAGAVDLLDPGSQPGETFLAFVAGELPPPGSRCGAIGVAVSTVRVARPRCGFGEAGDQGGDLLVKAVE